MPTHALQPIPTSSQVGHELECTKAALTKLAAYTGYANNCVDSLLQFSQSATERKKTFEHLQNNIKTVIELTGELSVHANYAAGLFAPRELRCQSCSKPILSNEVRYRCEHSGVECRGCRENDDD